MLKNVPYMPTLLRFFIINAYWILSKAFSASIDVCSCLVMSNSLQPCNPITHQAPLSIEFFRQEYWSGLLFPPPGDLPHLGVQSESLASPALTGRLFTTEPPGKPNKCILNFANEMGLLQILKSIKIDVCQWNTLTSREYVT